MEVNWWNKSICYRLDYVINLSQRGKWILYIINISLLHNSLFSIHLMFSKTISTLYSIYVHIFYSFYVCCPKFKKYPRKPYRRYKGRQQLSAAGRSGRVWLAKKIFVGINVGLVPHFDTCRPWHLSIFLALFLKMLLSALISLLSQKCFGLNIFHVSALIFLALLPWPNCFRLG